MIKAIVVDLGGVLFSEGKSVAADQLAREHGYDKDLVGKILASPESMALRKGLITDGEFWKWAQGQLPEKYDALLIKKAWYEGYVLDEELLALIEQMKRAHKIIAFSGNIKSRVEFLEERYRFRKLFHAEVYSFEYRLTKPSKKFVELMIEKSNCMPEEIVYIEDNDRYAQPARELGVKVVLYARGEVEKLKAELKKLGVRL